MEPFVFLVLAVLVQIISVVLSRVSKKAAEDARRAYRPPATKGVDEQDHDVGLAIESRAEPVKVAVTTRPAAEEAASPRRTRLRISRQSVRAGVIMSEVLGKPRSVFASQRRKLYETR